MAERFSASSSIDGPQHHEQFLPNLEPIVHFVRVVHQWSQTIFQDVPIPLLSKIGLG